MSDQLPLFDASKAMVEYHSPDGQSQAIQFDLDLETVWLTQKEMASLFHITVQAVGQQIKTFKKQRREAANQHIKRGFITASDGKNYEVEHYDLAVITFVGFNSQATDTTVAFQEFVVEVLRRFISQRNKPHQFMPKQSPMYRRAIDAGYTPEEAEAAAVIRENLKETTKATNAVRQQHGADGADYARLNELDSQVATGKTPRQWKQEFGDDKTPADYLSPLDNVSLAYEKRKAARTHEANQSQGVEEMMRDVKEIAPEVKENREILEEVLRGVPLTPQRKAKQLPLPKGK